MNKLLVSMVLTMLPVSALADYSCSATLTAVLVYNDGSINVFHPARNDYTYICNLNTPRLGVDTTTCAVWTALMLSARKNGTPVTFYYPGTGSCATLPVYSNSPAPTYIGEYAP
jgi:hypothetical protein